jgi:SET domain-containing protein
MSLKQKENEVIYKQNKTKTKKKKIGDLTYTVGFTYDYLSAERAGNDTRFINSSRYTNHMPNACFYPYQNRIFVILIRRVNPGDEILIDYAFKPYVFSCFFFFYFLFI